MEIVPAGQESSATAALMLDIVKSGGEAQTGASADLVLDLRQMVNKPAFSDVVFVCKDKNKVHASRMLLAGRSDVLQSMLMNGMAESNLDEINLPNIASPTLLSVFEFLYTGILLDYLPQTWRMACEVVFASHFFLLPKLERIIRKFMHSHTISVATDLSRVALLLTQAVEFKALSGQTDVNLMELVTILSSDCSDQKFVQGLSENALHYLLTNSKVSIEDDDEVTFEEYRRFRQVVRWFAYRSHSGTCSEERVNSLVPDEKTALSLCINYRDRENRPPEDATVTLDVWHSFLQDEGKESMDAVSRLMSHIDCRRIHPILLSTLLEPMKIIRAEQILSAVWFHALRRNMIFGKLNFGWRHGKSYLHQGYQIQRAGKQIGLAVATAAMSRHHGIYQWRMTVIQAPVPATSIEFGFLHFAGGGPGQMLQFDDVKLSDQNCARVLRMEYPQISANWKKGGGRFDWRDLQKIYNNSRAFFSYNASGAPVL